MRFSSSAQTGTTLPELMISVLLLGTFFTSIFEVNAVCLRYINATKESVAAIETVQDRLEKLRSLSFDELVNTAHMRDTVLAAAPNASSLAGVITEQVTITDFNDVTQKITYNRAAGTSVSPSNTPSGSFSFPATTKLVKVNVQHTWSMTLTGRTRTEEAETIISDGIKK